MSQIKKIDVNNVEDMARLREIDKDTEVLKWMVGEPMEEKELRDWVEEKDGNQLFGVYATEEQGQEMGKLQGWILLSEEKEVRGRVERVVGKKIDKRVVYEVSFAKYPGAAKGQMASGLREVIRLVSVKDFLMVAFAKPENVGSCRVLESVGFKRQDDLAAWDEKKPQELDYFYVLFDN